MFILKLTLILLSGVTSFYVSLNLYTLFITHQKWVLDYFTQKKNEKVVIKNFPSLCLQLSALLQSGHALPQALKHLAQSPNGRTFYHFLTSPTKKLDSDILEFLKHSLLLSSKNGIALSALLKRLSELARLEQEFEEKTKVLSYPTKAQATIAILLPWLVLSLFSLISPEMMSFAFSSWIGGVGFSTALLLELLALLWIKRILQ
ncbi:MAG: hypothetical protein HYY61_05685 [Deltaproteobacteria bacterium]|nr:hypothetical protein [Deltaproteobacteria bacterium]